MNELGYGSIPVNRIFGPATISAVSKWQRTDHSATTTLYGQVWADDWANLKKDR